MSDLIIDVGADIGAADKAFSSLNSEINKLDGHLGKVSKSGDKMAGSVDKGGKSALSAAGSVGSITTGLSFLAGGLMDAAKAATEEQVGMDRLQTTLKNSVQGYDEATAGVEDYIAQQTELAFADDQLRDSLNFLVGQTGDLTEAQELQATAMDLARAKGISLEAATKAVGKVDQESIGILKKLGIQVTDNMTKEEALIAIREQTAGQAKEFAEGPAGQMEIAMNKMGDAIEDVGKIALPIMSFALGVVQGAIDFILPAVMGLFDFFSNNTPALIALAGVITGILVPAFIAWATTMLSTTLPAIIATMAPIIAAAAPFIALAALVAGLWLAFETNFLGIRDLVKGVWDAIAPVFAAIGEALGTTLVNAWNVLADAAKAVVDNVLKPLWAWLSGPEVQGVVSWIVTALGTTLAGAWNTFMGLLTGLWNNILKPFWAWLSGPEVQAVISFIVTALGVTLATAWNTFTALLTGLWNNILKPFWAWLSGPEVQAVVSWIVTALGATLTGAWNAFTGLLTGLWNNVLKPLWAWLSGPEVQAVVSWIVAALGTTLTGAWNAFTAILQGIWDNLLKPLWTWMSGPEVQAVVSWIVNALGVTIGGAFTALQGIIKFLWDNVLKPFWAFFTSAPVKNAVSFIKDALVTVIGGAFNTLSGIASTVGGVISGIIAGIVAAINAAKAALDYLLSHSVYDSPAMPEQFKGKAWGGSVRGHQTYLVGEMGPELFTPGTSGWITPNKDLPRSGGTAITGAGEVVAHTQVNVYVDGVRVPARTTSGVLGERRRARTRTAVAL